MAADALLPDPLSDVVTLSGARCTVTRVMQRRGEWHCRFNPPGLVKFIAVAKGSCWLRHGGAEPLMLREDDILMLRGEHPFAMASDLSRPVDRPRQSPTTAVPNEECAHADFLAVCGHVALHSDRGGLLADALPPMVLVRGADRAAPMRWLLDQLIVEVNAERHGAALATTELAQLLFVHLVRACVASGDPLPTGWVGALADRRIAQALRLIHRHPGQDWRVGQLAAQVGMSRTSFAIRFSALLGTAPLAYLTAWRLRLAERALRTTDNALVHIAAAAGYRSTAAFGAAFARMFGLPPKRYRLRAAMANRGDAVQRVL